MQIDSLRLSHSSRSSGKSCWRKLEFRKFYGITGEWRSLDGDTGNALHRGYQDYLINQDRDKAIATMMLNYPIDLCSVPSHKKSLESCYATLNAMIDSGIYLEYEIAKIQGLDGIIRPAVEVPFEITIKNFSLDNTCLVPVTYIGYIDAVLFNVTTNEFVVADIKTTRWWFDDMTPIYLFDDQVLPYGMVLEKMLNRPMDSLTIQYMAVYVDIQKPVARKYEFEKNKQDIRDWGRGLYFDLQLIKSFYQNRWFPRSSGACTSFGKTCAHFEYCQSRNDETLQKLVEFQAQTIKVAREEFKPWVKIELELAI